MLFSEVIGHTDYKTDLVQAIDHDRLSHALLLLTPEGAGGLPMAMALSQYLVCTNKQDGDACGICAACKKAAKLVHPDIHFSYPVVPKKSGDKPISADYGKEWREFISQHPYSNIYQWLQFIGAENKQGNITARECGEIIRTLGLKSYESEFKVMIIWRPEFLRKEGNRLLKVIEEPPQKTVFILVAEQSENILNTILSRTQLIRMPSLNHLDLSKALIQNESLDEREAQRVAALADGDYNAALHIVKQDTANYMNRLRAWLNAILGKKPGLLSQWITSFVGAKVGREEHKQFLRYFIKQLEYALQIEFNRGGDLTILPEEEKFAKNLLKLASFFQIRDMIGYLEDACYHVERNVNVKILFHATSIQLRAAFRAESLPVE